jgi:hypothetical protein
MNKSRRALFGKMAGLLGFAAVAPAVLRAQPQIAYESTQYGRGFWNGCSDEYLDECQAIFGDEECEKWIEGWPDKGTNTRVTWEPQRGYKLGDKLTSKGWNVDGLEETWELQSDNVFRVIKANK